MKLEGSCHCGAVRFSVESDTFHPYNRCYCSICRKTAGGGGYAINIMAKADSLTVSGLDHITVYRSAANDRESYDADGLGRARRHFCSKCGSALWVHGPDYPDWIYPFASAIDTPLPVPAERTHLMLAHKASWVETENRPLDAGFDHYPDTGIADWHKQRGLDGTSD